MNNIEILVEPKSKSHVGWFVHLFSWNKQRRDLIAHRLKLKSRTGGKFTLSSEAKLPNGTYGLRLHVIESGNKASITVVEKPPISYPMGAAWPMTVEVPAQFTQDSDTWFFEHGDEA
ncbi:hypothetical protein C8024_13090 [Sphingopyxis sp. BSNA05]|uniref:hypothetical protein n=1 Tax=Sphingomonadales TaxID=204457 RepID=UPI000C1EBD17|nr:MULTISPECIES: hypothetical protein [Sphingomonadaceae]ATW03817.1 hypothetical protein CHN51_09935 [Sphingorhabdus sp. YGSMI21]NRD90197.1 hypothetical protein [Sphingopyxis sp. BSNA05]